MEVIVLSPNARYLEEGSSYDLTYEDFGYWSRDAEGTDMSS
jgi:hypothetical protein